MRSTERGLRRREREDGVIAGGEALAFGLLTFVVGTLLVTNAWGVVDAKTAVTAAAREATRAFVEASDAATGEVRATEVAATTIAGHGHDPNRMNGPEMTGAFARCSRVTSTVSYTVPAIALPWIGGLGETEVTGRHSEIVDPYRSGLDARDPRGAEPDCA